MTAVFPSAFLHKRTYDVHFRFRAGADEAHFAPTAMMHLSVIRVYKSTWRAKRGKG